MSQYSSIPESSSTPESGSVPASGPSPASGSAPAADWGAVVGTLRAAGCVFAEDEARLLIEAADTPAALRDMVAQRVAGLPLEHIVGWVEFCGLRVAVDPGVFVPRQRTGLLVRRAAAQAASAPGSVTGPAAAGPAAGPAAADPTAAARPVVVDLACGSGAVGMAVAALVPNAALYAVDIEPAAVRCARRNLTPIGGQVYEGDLYAPLPDRLRGHVDVVVANVPYVPTDAVGLMPREARDHEPRVTLDGGFDGLDVLRRVAQRAGDWLVPGGQVLMEIGEDQADAAVGALTGTGLAAAVENDDDLHAWIVVGRRQR
ncbi:methyltransferase [Rugosimonospora africana]|uniref:Methylase n=1 Tax=Rugosimonospora africana TaxID=556532 RepID=A0A8J3VQ32_9ACTN|nr:methyltransferase [Rugosimonospora africana]GIH14725.1 methylase [Rugosimonospora africana]